MSIVPSEQNGNSRYNALSNQATALPYQLLSDRCLTVSKDYAYFANLNLDAKAVETRLSPYMDLVEQRISLTYKVPAKVSFQGINGICKLALCDWLQFDDLCIKFLHVVTGADVLITVNTQLARSLLIRLLSTTLVDDTHGVLFSSTEKGIFSFIIARLLLDLKHTLVDKMPDLKLIGIYHCQDESINDTAIANYGVFNFSFAFAHDHFPVSIALPITIFNTMKLADPKLDLMARCGHITAPMTFTVATLSMAQETFANLAFGDLIIFERARFVLQSGRLKGTIHGTWHGIAIDGELATRDGHYSFTPNLAHSFTRIEDINMEKLDIAGVDTATAPKSSENNHKLADLAKDIRVSLRIELSRVPLTLKELCQIREGEIIDLHRKIDDPLDMVVEGKIIGHCQPVQIDGRLGIRVLNIDGESDTEN